MKIKSMFWLCNRVTTGLIFMKFNWFKICCSQSNEKKSNRLDPIVQPKHFFLYGYGVHLFNSKFELKFYEF